MTALTLLSGSANPGLATAVAGRLGTPLAACIAERFPDGEIHIEVRETVRGHDVYLIQPTCPPVADHVLELLLLADACRRSEAARLTAVVPYFGYARQDRRATGREAIGARLVADLFGTSGFDRVVALDLHTAASEAFFPVPVQHLTAVPMLANTLRPVPDRAVVVSPDLGAVRLADHYGRLLNLPVATVHKIRTGPAAVEVRQVAGEVRGRAAMIVDDMISTGHTIAAAVRALLAAGCAPDITVVVSHGLFVGAVESVLQDLPIGRIITTDSVPRQPNLLLPITVASVAPLLAEVIGHLHRDESIGEVIPRR